MSLYFKYIYSLIRKVLYSLEPRRWDLDVCCVGSFAYLLYNINAPTAPGTSVHTEMLYHLNASLVEKTTKMLQLSGRKQTGSCSYNLTLINKYVHIFTIQFKWFKKMCIIKLGVYLPLWRILNKSRYSRKRKLLFLGTRTALLSTSARLLSITQPTQTYPASLAQYWRLLRILSFLPLLLKDTARDAGKSLPLKGTEIRNRICGSSHWKSPAMLRGLARCVFWAIAS